MTKKMKQPINPISEVMLEVGWMKDKKPSKKEKSKDTDHYFGQISNRKHQKSKAEKKLDKSEKMSMEDIALLREMNTRK